MHGNVWFEHVDTNSRQDSTISYLRDKRYVSSFILIGALRPGWGFHVEPGYNRKVLDKLMVVGASFSIGAEPWYTGSGCVQTFARRNSRLSGS